MHDEIKRFALEGQIDSSNLVEAKDRLVLALEAQMRDDGFVPVLDLEPQFTRTYNVERENYDFTLSVYGAYVGRNKECETAGIMSGKRIQSYMQNPKLKQS